MLFVVCQKWINACNLKQEVRVRTWASDTTSNAGLEPHYLPMIFKAVFIHGWLISFLHAKKNTMLVGIISSLNLEVRIHQNSVLGPIMFHASSPTSQPTHLHLWSPSWYQSPSIAGSYHQVLWNTLFPTGLQSEPQTGRLHQAKSFLDASTAFKASNTLPLSR